MLGRRVIWLSFRQKPLLLLEEYPGKPYLRIMKWTPVAAFLCRLPVRLLLGILLLCSGSLSAQDHNWWSNNVQWDGISHWREYLIFAPRYLGPNALPVPEQTQGQVFSESEIRVTGNGQWAPGDRTWHPALYVRYAAWPDRISFDVYWVPLEFFHTTHDWKTERRVFHTAYDAQKASGDILLNTQIRVVPESDRWPGVALRVGYRLPSSNTVGAARFTDSPGFHFDLSAGKDYALWAGTWRPVAMLGLLVWQTNLDTHVQNDAVLFGGGFSYQREKWESGFFLRGYAGYLSNGDRPLLAEAYLKKSWKRGHVFLRFQHGMNDRLYDRLELGLGRPFSVPAP